MTLLTSKSVPDPVRILISTFGSYGDLFPYLALGSELGRRGHQVTVATSELYRSKVGAAGMNFHAVRPDVSFDNRELLAYVMDAKRGSERIIRYLASAVRESYADLEAEARSADLIVTHPITFASVLAAQKLGKPWVSSVLSPISFLSAYDPPVLAPAPWLHRLSFLGPRITGAWMGFGKRQALTWLEPVLQLRAELGLGRGSNPLFEGQHSPALVLALFSPLVAERQPDWPPQSKVTGFCFFDEGEMASGLQTFLNAGPPPVVFTLGSSAVGAAGNFYRHSLEAAQRLGVRAVFLTGSQPQDFPEELAPGMIRIAYAPHFRLFSGAAAVVHQGGIGTTAQALRSGRPMLIVPFAHDQFDNAERARKLGVAEVLPRTRFTAKAAEKKLAAILGSPSYRQAAEQTGECVRFENGSAAAADAVERL